jgi:membrane-bound lytic murein transglycosylase B
VFANLPHTSGWQLRQPYREGTANFQAMREWNHSKIYRQTLVLFAEQLGGHPDPRCCVRRAG